MSLGVALPGPGKRVTAVVDGVGRLQVRPWIIHMGAVHAGRSARVMLDDTHAAVFIDEVLVRHFELDQTHTYQPSGLPRGGRARRVP